MIFKLPTCTMQSGHYRGRHQRVAGKVAVAHSGARTFPLAPRVADFLDQRGRGRQGGYGTVPDQADRLIRACKRQLQR